MFISYIKFDKPIYHIHGFIEIPVEFHAYTRPESVGYFLGTLRYDGGEWELDCTLQKNSAKVVFHKRSERQREMVKALINSSEFLEIKSDFQQIIDSVGGKFESTVLKWQKRINRMLEYNKLYIMMNLSEEATEFIKNSELTFAKFVGGKLKLVFNHPDLNWILTLWSEELMGVGLYNKNGKELWKKHFKDGDTLAIVNLLKQQKYYKTCCRAAEEIITEMSAHCFAESAKNSDLTPTLVRSRLVRSLTEIYTFLPIYSDKGNG